MQAGKNNFTAFEGCRFHARWADRQDMAPMERDVEGVRHFAAEWHLLSPVHIPENTQVYLSGDLYTGNGIVRSCRQENFLYLLTLDMSADAFLPSVGQDFDPGLLEVDGFLTEEEESKILDSLKAETPCSVMVHRIVTYLHRTVFVVLQSSVQPWVWMHRKATGFLGLSALV